MEVETGANTTDVHCRTGSLEMRRTHLPGKSLVHCRTGSLENALRCSQAGPVVHCRTGSLEKLGSV